jgi:hypothetical protein
MDQQSAKICAICGKDCSNDPRIKDPKGRYFHRDCYERAAQAQARHRPTPPAPASDTPPVDSIPVEPAPLEPLAAEPPTYEPPPVAQPHSEPPPPKSEDYTDVFAVEDDSQSELPPEAIYQTAHTTDFSCPGCGAAMGPGAIICTNCGYNTRTGKQMGIAAVDEGPRPAAGGGQVWPTVVGAISIIFGASGTLLYLLSAVANMATGSTGGEGAYGAGYSTGRVVGGLLPILFCVWLLISGIGIVRRRQSAMISIRRWAIAKIAVFATCFSCLFGVLFISASAIDRMNAELGGALAGVGVVVIALLLLVFLAWFLFWPVFILIWFGREKIQQDVGTWH